MLYYSIENEKNENTNKSEKKLKKYFQKHSNLWNSGNKLYYI